MIGAPCESTQKQPPLTPALLFLPSVLCSPALASTAQIASVSLDASLAAAWPALAAQAHQTVGKFFQPGADPVKSRVVVTMASKKPTRLGQRMPSKSLQVERAVTTVASRSRAYAEM